MSLSPQTSAKAQCRCTNTLPSGVVCHSYEMIIGLQLQPCQSEFATRKVVCPSVSAIDLTPLISHLINEFEPVEQKPTSLMIFESFRLSVA